MCAAPFGMRNRNYPSECSPIPITPNVGVPSMNIGKPLLQHIASKSPHGVIIGGNLLTGKGAAVAVGGGQEIWDSLYGAVNYHRASPWDYTL